MASHEDDGDHQGPGFLDHAVSALDSWIGDYLADTDNPLHEPMAFFDNNKPLDLAELPSFSSQKACVLVHGLASNEGIWRFPKPRQQDDYGSMLASSCGYTPLYLRYNSGLRISRNGKDLSLLLDDLLSHAQEPIGDLLLIGHSMGGLVIRSACHHATVEHLDWVSRVGRVIYLGSPHLGAPLEKFTNVSTHVLGLFDTTATRVIRDLLNTRSAGVKDLRYGNLLDEDWLEFDPDELLNDRRVPVPWLASAKHHRVIGHMVPKAQTLGDGMVRPPSAAAERYHRQPGAPTGDNIAKMPGLGHVTLAHHQDVYDQIERWVNSDG